MMSCPLRPLLAALVLVLPAAAPAAERSVYVASFDKVRVLGPFEVRIAHDRPAGATLVGEGRVIDTVEVQVDGSTLSIRSRIGRWEEQPRAAATTPVVVTIGAPADIASASVIGGGRLAIDRMKGARLDLTVTGPGTIAVGDAQGDAANATVIGQGAITLAGRAGQARLMTNGSGTIDAAGLDAGDLTVRLDGPGATTARARYTARVIDTGLGQVTVAGNPKCTVVASAGGPVSCGGG